MTKVTCDLIALPTPEPARTTTERLAAPMKPYKLRRLSDNKQAVIIKVPVRFGGEYTYLFLAGDMTWCSGGEAGTNHINNNYEYIGPLLPGESVTIAG